MEIPWMELPESRIAQIDDKTYALKLRNALILQNPEKKRYGAIIKEIYRAATYVLGYKFTIKGKQEIRYSSVYLFCYNSKIRESCSYDIVFEDTNIRIIRFINKDILVLSKLKQ
jgi:hypothetical protein